MYHYGNYITSPSAVAAASNGAFSNLRSTQCSRSSIHRIPRKGNNSTWPPSKNPGTPCHCCRAGGPAAGIVVVGAVGNKAAAVVVGSSRPEEEALGGMLAAAVHRRDPADGRNAVAGCSSPETP